MGNCNLKYPKAKHLRGKGGKRVKITHCSAEILAVGSIPAPLLAPGAICYRILGAFFPDHLGEQSLLSWEEKMGRGSLENAAMPPSLSFAS